MHQWHPSGIRGEPDAIVRYIVIIAAALLLVTTILPWDVRQGLFQTFASGGSVNPLALPTSPFLHTSFFSGALTIFFFFLFGRGFLFLFGREKFIQAFVAGTVGGWLFGSIFSPDLRAFTYGRPASLPADFRACGLSAPGLAMLAYMAMKTPGEVIHIFPLPMPVPLRVVAGVVGAFAALGCLSNNPHRASSGYHFGAIGAGAALALAPI